MLRYYVMDLDKGMAETVAQEAPTAAEVAACSWLTEDELRVYSCEFGRTGFQGGLQWYRHIEDPKSITRGSRCCAHKVSRAPGLMSAMGVVASAARVTSP